MYRHPDVVSAIQKELYDWRLWTTRVVVLAFASLAGLTVVAFTLLSDLALKSFHFVYAASWWSQLVYMPLFTGAIVWCTQKYAPGAAGSGIPQVMAALSTNKSATSLFVSFRLSIAKLLLTTWGLLAGLSLGREGPSVQIAAGVMHSARRWLPKSGVVSDHGLLMAGGAAGIAAAFNTPLGGVLFAIEELTRKPEQRSNGLIMAAIILGGLMAVSAFGNSTYFGVIPSETIGLSLLVPGLLVAVASGLAGGLFSRIMIVSLSGASTDWFSRQRHKYPVYFATSCGLVIALIGLATNGGTFGSGYVHTRALLDGTGDSSSFYVLLKFVATWLTTWSGVPGGVFAPSLAIGAALGADIASWTGHAQGATLIALGMAGFLAAVTQAPMTAFVIVMEMVDGHGLVLSLMACSLLSSGISRLVSAPLYPTLADLQLKRIPPEGEKKGATKGSKISRLAADPD
jgi:H+/Cl- antiporter ClcA